MEKKHEEALRKNWVFLMDNLIMDGVLDSMMSKETFTSGMVEEVSVKQTRKDKATQFLFTLIRRGPHAFDLFLEALRENSQDFIADQLVDTLNGKN
jgi:hypothetical protein